MNRSRLAAGWAVGAAVRARGAGPHDGRGLLPVRGALPRLHPGNAHRQVETHVSSENDSHYVWLVSLFISALMRVPVICSLFGNVGPW